MRKITLLIIVLFVNSSCVLKIKEQKKTFNIQKYLNTELSDSHNGVVIFDPISKKEIFTNNKNLLFVPASNTKILTLFASLSCLEDSIVGLKYLSRNDTLYFWGTGDPSLLHPDLEKSNVYDFLKNAKEKTLVYSDSNFKNKRLGSGWSWDDYNDYYQTELSSLPIYGNIARVNIQNGLLKVNPSHLLPNFNSNMVSKTIEREELKNEYYFNPDILTRIKFTQDIPFTINNNLIINLLEDTLKRKITYSYIKVSEEANSLKSIAADSVYKRMMKISDNMLAEHLLLLSGQKYDSEIATEKAIANILENNFSFLSQKINWVDGSGLSRYNLMSPQSLVEVLDKMIEEHSESKIFPLMAIGGETGTLKNSYSSQKPFLFAKSGSMGGVYNLSGYLITKTGRLLIFSVLTNNFIGTVSNQRKKVSLLINKIHQLY